MLDGPSLANCIRLHHPSPGKQPSVGFDTRITQLNIVQPEAGICIGLVLRAHAERCRNLFRCSLGGIERSLATQEAQVKQSKDVPESLTGLWILVDEYGTGANRVDICGRCAI